VSYDEQPDGDPHGECVAHILALGEENARLRILLADTSTAILEQTNRSVCQRAPFLDLVTRINQALGQ
jgi:hypothetical protein